MTIEIDSMTIKTDKINRALNIIEQCGGIDGAHHKMWVMAQVTRRLMGSIEGEATVEYLEWVKTMKNGKDGLDTYDWDEGIAP